jgi:hypothetical protein
MDPEAQKYVASCTRRDCSTTDTTNEGSHLGLTDGPTYDVRPSFMSTS